MKLSRILCLALLAVATGSTLLAMRPNPQVTLISVALIQPALERILSYLNAEEKNNVRELSLCMREITDPLIRNLQVSRFNNASFGRIKGAAPFLKLLVVPYDGNDALFVQDADQELLLPIFPSLEQLTISSKVFPKILARSLAKNKGVLLACMKKINMRLIKPTVSDLVIIIGSCPFLQDLNLGLDYNALTSIEQVLTQNPNALMDLRMLKISNSYSTALQIANIIQLLPSLVHLSLHGCQNTPEAIVQALTSNQGALANADSISKCI